MASILLLAIFTYLDIQNKLETSEVKCFTELAKKMEDGRSPQQIFDTDLESLQILVEQSLVARSEMLKVAGNLKERADAPLSSRDLQILKQGTEDYLLLREKLYEVAHSYECSIEIEEGVMLKHSVSPLLRLKGAMLSLSAALTLYDNYLLGTLIFEQDGRLRKVINDPDMGFGIIANKLLEMTLTANSIETRHRIRKVIDFYEDSKPYISNTEQDEAYNYLQLLIESSPSYNYVKKVRINEIAANKLTAFGRVTSDAILKSKDAGFDLLSGLFGNTLGLYESRKGKLYGDKNALEAIKKELQPLDILLEKTPFRLTDKLIPGHFGHVAIWTGTKAELISLDLWEDSHILPYATNLSNPEKLNSKDEHQVIEALRSGVQLSTLEHFMNIDDFAILRPVFDTKNKESFTKEALLMAFRQIGKKYDFNFDVNTTDKIVCSELAYISFPSMEWPTNKTLGKHNISPDNVAKLAWNNLPLELVLFYHDGKLVPEDQKVDKMIALMQQ